MWAESMLAQKSLFRTDDEQGQGQTILIPEASRYRFSNITFGRLVSFMPFDVESAAFKICEIEHRAGSHRGTLILRAMASEIRRWREVNADCDSADGVCDDRTEHDDTCTEGHVRFDDAVRGGTQTKHHRDTRNIGV